MRAATPHILGSLRLTSPPSSIHAPLRPDKLLCPSSRSQSQIRSSSQIRCWSSCRQQLVQPSIPTRRRKVSRIPNLPSAWLFWGSNGSLPEFDLCPHLPSSHNSTRISVATPAVNRVIGPRIASKQRTLLATSASAVPNVESLGVDLKQHLRSTGQRSRRKGGESRPAAQSSDASTLAKNNGEIAKSGERA